MGLINKKHLPPETIVFTGDIIEDTIVRTFYYNEKELFMDQDISNEKDYTNFIKINGFSDQERIKTLLQNHQIDPMIIEDVFNVTQRSKIEVNDEVIFVVLKTLEYKDGLAEYSYVSVILKDNVVISINEKHSGIFDNIIERLQKSNGIIRKKYSAYLLYALIDVIIDLDLQTIKEIEDHLTEIEDMALEDQLENKNDVYLYRKDLNYLKNSIATFHDTTCKTALLSHKLITPDITKYYYDVFDHVYKLGEKIGNCKETLRIIYEIQMNNISLNMNRIMQTLTIFSAIFIPLSFLAGVFGMNFVSMPLLQLDTGFIIFTILCFSVLIGMLYYFKRRRFL